MQKFLPSDSAKFNITSVLKLNVTSTVDGLFQPNFIDSMKWNNYGVQVAKWKEWGFL